MIKSKISNRAKELGKRIERSPKYAVALVNAKLKADALSLIKTFHDGIKERSFNLIKLEDGTIARKKAEGMERPTTPMYARGDEKKKNSYVNMLRLRKLKNGWRVQPSTGKHHTADISLKLLYFVHEFGTIIGRRDGTMIRIPPRPALYRAYRRVLLAKATHERSKVVKAAIQRNIRDAKAMSVRQATAQFTRGLERYEKNAIAD